MICIFGFGQSGISAARYLQRIEQPFVVCDTRIDPPGKVDLSLLNQCKGTYFGDIPQSILNDSSMIILSPGVPLQDQPIQEAIACGVKIIGDIEIFVRSVEAKVVAITGSNGKSTVTDLTCQLLCAAGLNAKVGGNFGIPVLDYLPERKAKVDVYVLELSSFQLDTTQSLEVDVATVLNVSEDHMDRYPNFAAYRQSKLRIYNEARIAMFNANDSLTQTDSVSDGVMFGIEDASAKYRLVKEDEEYWFAMDDLRILRTSDLKIAGKHNWSNLLAALGLLGELGIEYNDKVVAKIKDYQGLAHRFQLIANHSNIDWINDSKATNVGATNAALEGIDSKYYDQVVLIAGGDSKKADLLPLKKNLEEKVSRLILIGKDSALFATLLAKEKIEYAKDMQDAVVKSKAFVQDLDKSNRLNLVLLSPACASLDMFRNYEARGDAFIEAVRACA